MKKGIQHSTIKCKMKSVLNFPNMLPIINDRVNQVNQIWIEAYLLLNQHLLKLINNKKDIFINYNTIERCVLLVLNNDTVRKKDSNYYELLDTYNKYYKPLGQNLIEGFNKTKSITRPFEDISREIMVNINNHCKFNFYKFQKRYLKDIVFDKFLKLKINKRVLTSILNCIQFHINNPVKKLEIKSKLILKDKNLKDIQTLMIKIIKAEKKKIPKVLLENIDYNNLELNIDEVLKYYHFMIGHLEENDKKRFSLLPQIKLGYSYIHFDSRFLSTIYDEWLSNISDEEKKKLISIHKKHKLKIDINSNKVGIKAFESNYKEYFKLLFNFGKIKRKGNLISFQTNGYSVCLLFEIPKVKISKNPNKNKIDLEEYFGNKKFKKGLFDADNCKASQDFLDKFHHLSIDPNNSIMLYGYSETGKPIKISKGYFNEESHITKNTRKMKRYINESNMKKIYEELKDTNYKKTIKMENFGKFIKIIRKNWKTIWTFYGQNKLLALELDTFINKKKTIHKIIRKLVPKNSQLKFNNFPNTYLDNSEEILKKPIMISFGKGNGSITISNLRNSGPKGPIKTIAKELSQFCIVVLVDEYNTSKMCSSCKSQELEHPEIERTKKKKIKGTKKTKIEKKKISCHGLCYCKNKIHSKSPIKTNFGDSNVHKIWNRDYNASRNIGFVMKQKLLGKSLGKFDRVNFGSKIKTS